MSGAIGRSPEILQSRGRVSIGATDEIKLSGLYISAILSLVMAMLKLIAMVHWSWWRVILPLGVFLGNNAAHILVGFICLFVVRYGEDEVEEEPPVQETKLVRGFQLAALIYFVIFLDNLVRWIEGGRESNWFWLFSGKMELVGVFGVLSLTAQFLYWSGIIGIVNGRQRGPW